MKNLLPIIDLNGFVKVPSVFDRVTVEIGAACRGPGFFYIVNHGVSSELISAVFALSKAFFEKPVAEKDRLAMTVIGNNRGYSGLKNERLDPDKPADLKEAFNIGLELPENHPEINDRYRGRNGWPEEPEFKSTMLEYYDACLALGQSLHRAFARDLGLPLDFFANKIDRPMATLRLLHYPPQPKDAKAGEIGAGIHTDYGNITLLMTDDVGGLEVRKRGHEAWIPAPPIPGAFIVNIGDCLMRWTSDVYVSTPHRVINATGRERYSLAYFLDPNPDAIVEAIESCVDTRAAPKYQPVSGADYLTERLNATYQVRPS